MHFEGTDEQTSALLAALVSAQSEFPPIPKTKTAGEGGRFSYKYAPLNEIQEVVSPILAKHDLGLSHHIVSVNTKQHLGTMLFHSAGGRMWFEGLEIPSGIKPTEQGAHISYARRYGLSAILNIVTEEDNENRLKEGRSSSGKRAPVVDPAPRLGHTGDSGVTPDPSLPNPKERAEYRKHLNEYRAHVSDKSLEQFLLSRTNVPEVRLIPRKHWDEILQELDSALLSGPDTLTQLVET